LIADERRADADGAACDLVASVRNRHAIPLRRRSTMALQKISTAAQFAKLFANAFRYIEFATTNELKSPPNAAGANCWKRLA
jgi:hypothetical protein